MTDVGRAREKNEDNYIRVPSHGLFLVADGMGGHASGQLASMLAVKHITEFLCVQALDPDFDWPYRDNQHLPHEHRLLDTAVRHANERIYIEACKDPSHEGMGTTIVTIRDPGGPNLVLAHAGDSRIYRFRNDTLSQVTRDHSLVNHLLDSGKIKPEEAENYPNKNVIYRALGLKDDLEVEINEVPKRAGDLYLLCSDGLSDLVEDWAISEILSQNPDLKSACRALIDMANRNGGSDNITVTLLVLEEDRPTGPPPVPR